MLNFSIQISSPAPCHGRGIQSYEMKAFDSSDSQPTDQNDVLRIFRRANGHHAKKYQRSFNSKWLFLPWALYWANL